MTAHRPNWKHVAWAAAALAALAGVFMLYTRPEFLINMADQLWSCF
ncbi:MAG: hypothetical protein IAE92_10990 [Burkholderiaceae bacterium]|nr:hypothetical protein [Burkholderiaceae bacterium]